MPPTGAGDTRVRVEVRAVIGRRQSRMDRARSHSGRIRSEPDCRAGHSAARIASSIPGNANENPDSNSRIGNTR